MHEKCLGQVIQQKWLDNYIKYEGNNIWSYDGKILHKVSHEKKVYY